MRVPHLDGVGRLPVTMTRAWVAFYTLGLPPELREDRRAELASDVWEHDEDARRSGRRPAAAGLAIGVRCAKGMPADLTWRFGHARPRRSAAAAWGRTGGPALAAGAWLGRRSLPGAAYGLALLYLVIGTVVLLTLPWNDTPRPGGTALVSAWAVVAGGSLGFAARIRRRRPARAAVVMVASALPLGLILVQSVIAPLLTLPVLALAVHTYRKRRSLQ